MLNRITIDPVLNTKTITNVFIGPRDFSTSGPNIDLYADNEFVTLIMDSNTALHTRELATWVEAKLNKEILSLKREDVKKRREKEKTEIMRFYRGQAAELQKIFDLQNGIVEAKNMIIKKLQQIKQVTGSFLRTDDGFKVTNPEGFVAVDKLKGNAVKLVDRIEFSHANFTATKNWSK